mmetsp:Transcript_126775/g.236951  ORF Transcript_126775/g.236951 Transcript_126775/m.236951 type:complete len:228 (+) Transcript_126775:232-915(+)
MALEFARDIQLWCRPPICLCSLSSERKQSDHWLCLQIGDANDDVAGLWCLCAFSACLWKHLPSHASEVPEVSGKNVSSQCCRGSPVQLLALVSLLCEHYAEFAFTVCVQRKSKQQTYVCGAAACRVLQRELVAPLSRHIDGNIGLCGCLRGVHHVAAEIRESGLEISRLPCRMRSVAVVHGSKGYSHQHHTGRFRQRRHGPDLAGDWGYGCIRLCDCLQASVLGQHR